MRERRHRRPFSDPGEVAAVLVTAHPRGSPEAASVSGDEQNGDVRRVPGFKAAMDRALQYTTWH